MTQPLLGAHIPWAQIDTYLEEVLNLGLVPEVAIKGPELDGIDLQALQRVSQTIAGANFRPRVHAPFFDLNPGAVDPVIRNATRMRLSQALEFAGQLNAELMVIHPGVDKWRYPNLSHVWCDNAFLFFQDFIKEAKGTNCRLALENIYEETPDILIQLVDGLNSEWFGHCFDAGHWHLFGRMPLADWLDAINPRLLHLHLHDNHGRADEHLPVGQGTIDFLPLQKHLNQLSKCPSITLEAHNRQHLLLSMQNVKAMLA